MGGTGGGGGGSAGKVTVPSQVGGNALSADDLSKFAAGTFPGVLSLINWAGDLATGGNFNQSFSPWNEWGYSSTLGSSPGGAGIVGGGGAVGGGASPYPTTFPGFTGGEFTGGGGGGGGAMPWDQSNTAQTTPSTLSPAQVQQLLQAGYQFAGGQGITPGMKFDPSSQLSGVAQPPGKPPLAASTLGQFFGTGSGPGPATPAGPSQAGGGQTLKSGNPVSWDWIAHDANLPTSAIADFIKQGKTPQQVAQQYGLIQTTDSLLGPFLSTAWNAIGQEQNTIGAEIAATHQLDPLMKGTADFTRGMNTEASQLYAGAGPLADRASQLYASAGPLADRASQLYNQGEAGLSGKLTPEQQAYVDQATNAEKTAIASQLGAAGLGSSTSNVMLRGEADQQRAATEGGLINQNRQIAQAEIGLSQTQQELAQKQIAASQAQQQLAQQQINLAQGASKLALGGMELSLGEQTALEQEMANIFQQHAVIQGQGTGMQAQMWSEAIQGYGVLGQMIQTALGGLKDSSDSFKQYTEASIAEVQANAAIEEANIKASQSSGSGLGSGLGSLFSGIGGLFGAGAGAGAAAAGGVGAAAGVSGGVEALATVAVGAV